MKALFCGDRYWLSLNTIQHVFNWLEREMIPITLLIEGECRGADLMSRFIAERKGVPIMAFPAKWKEHGKAAGHIRNQQMLDEGKPDIVVAFHADLATSKGTKDMINRSLKANIDTWLHDGLIFKQLTWETFSRYLEPSVL